MKRKDDVAMVDRILNSKTKQGIYDIVYYII